MTNKRRATLASLHAREDEALRKAMQAGIEARRRGIAREANPYPGYSWKRNWNVGWDYEDTKQAKADPIPVPPAA